MNSPAQTSRFSRWLTVTVFAVAMAWVEAAVVFYLRTHVDRIQPYQPNPLPNMDDFGGAELIREAATLVMLLAVGSLAGTTWRSRLGYTAIAFGVWDIFYYVFLKVMTGWPGSLMDWDILFLLPLPWWGPVWAPVSIAVLMILWGTFVTKIERPTRIAGSNWQITFLGCLGIALALYVFMADAIRMADEGVEALRHMLPNHFNTPLFLVALVLMAAPVIEACIIAGRTHKPPAPAPPH